MQPSWASKKEYSTCTWFTPGASLPSNVRKRSSGCFVVWGVDMEQSPRYLPAPDWEHPLAGGYSPEALATFNQNLRFDRSAAAKGFIRSIFSEAPPQETIDEMYAETTKTPTSAAIAAMTDMTYADLRPALEKVTVPALLLYGEQSKLFPGDLGSWLQAQITDSKLVMFEESGHCPFWEEPEKFNREVADFVG